MFLSGKFTIVDYRPSVNQSGVENNDRLCFVNIGNSRLSVFVQPSADGSHEQTLSVLDLEFEKQMRRIMGC